MEPSPTPATDAATIEELLPPDWWEEHRGKIIAGIVLLLVVIVTWTVVAYFQRKREIEARAALSQAASVEQLREVAKNFSGTPEAASADFLAAVALMEEQKWEEAFAAFASFEKQYPEHSLAAAALVAQGAIRESEAKYEEAKSLYQLVSTRYQTTYVAPYALLGEARMYEALGSPEDAKKMLTEIVTRMPGSVFAVEASGLLEIQRQ